MNEEKQKRLQELGVDTEELLARFMGNEALMTRFLGKFPQDENFGRLEQALEAGDAAGAYAAAHTLKGVTGNLSLARLYQLVCAVVEPLRENDIDTAKKNMPALRQQYGRTVEGIAAEMQGNR